MNALETFKAFVVAVEAGADVREHLHPELVQLEHPNRLYANGIKRGLPEVLDGAEKGRKVLRSQRYEIRSAIADGDRVALQLEWTGELAIPLGKLQPGDRMRAQLAMFAVIKDGKVWRLENYDCYEPF
jgi:hypothetical protein